MCLIVLAYDVIDGTPLVLGANRDEAHARPTAKAARWPDGPVGGRDLDKGGSWLLVTQDGRLAAVTNHRRRPFVVGGPSRGLLVRDFVAGTASARDYVHLRQTDGFASFNLLVYDGVELWQLEDDRGPSRVEPGIHGLSNARLDDPWPKVTRAKAALERAVTLPRDAMVERMFAALADRGGASDDELPETGVGIALERVLAPPFIVSPTYGTRSSSVVVIGATAITFEERSFDAAGSETTREHFTLAR